MPHSSKHQSKEYTCWGRKLLSLGLYQVGCTCVSSLAVAGCFRSSSAVAENADSLAKENYQGELAEQLGSCSSSSISHFITFYLGIKTPWRSLCCFSICFNASYAVQLCGLDLHKHAKGSHHEATNPALPKAPEVGHMASARGNDTCIEHGQSVGAKWWKKRNTLDIIKCCWVSTHPHFRNVANLVGPTYLLLARLNRKGAQLRHQICISCDTKTNMDLHQLRHRNTKMKNLIAV